MLVIVEKTGRVIGYDKLAICRFATDLTPVPVNLELSLILDDDLEESLKEDEILLVGEDQTRLKIIKTIAVNPQTVVEDKRQKIMSLVAVLDGCEVLINPLQKAVILDSINFAGAYRACGCRAKFRNDISIKRFVSAFGTVPTYEIASCLQEEAALVYFDKDKLSVKRVVQFFDQEPVMTLDNSAIAWMNNPRVEKNKVPSFVSVDAVGEFVNSSSRNDQPATYYPDADARQLKNLNTILITRGVATRPMDATLKAGDIVLVNDKKYVFLTVVHYFSSGALGGARAQVTRIWLATLSE